MADATHEHVGAFASFAFSDGLAGGVVEVGEVKGAAAILLAVHLLLEPVQVDHTIICL